MDLLIPSKQENFTNYIHYYFFSDCRGIDQNLNGEMLRAVRQDDKEKIETLIENCGDVNAASSTLGNTVLIYSAQSGNEEIVNLLIEKGGLISESFSILKKFAKSFYRWIINANVNAKSVDGFTALMVAADRGHKPIVEKLIVNKADVCVRND